MMTRKPYPSDVSDDEWAFVVPYLTLLPLEAEQRKHDLREVFNALRYLVRTGGAWRYLPNDFPPWAAVYQQTQRWLADGSFEAIVHDLRTLLRVAKGRDPQPTAVIFDRRTLQSTPESGARAGYDGYKRKRGSPGGRQAARGEERLRPPAQAVGRGDDPRKRPLKRFR